MADILSQKEIDDLLDIVEDRKVPFFAIADYGDDFGVTKVTEEIFINHNVPITSDNTVDGDDALAISVAIMDSDIDHLTIHKTMVDVAFTLQQKLKTHAEMVARVKKEEAQITKIKQWLEDHPEYNL